MLERNVNYPGIYIGVVEANNDPLNQGRVRVRILGFHSSEKVFNGQDGIAIDDLPWAVPANPIQGGSISGLGWSGVPVKGSHVAIFFVGGDHNYPVYFASIGGIYKTKPSTSKGFCDPDGIYPKAVNTPDFNSLASPTCTVFETPDNGVRVEYDSTSGSEKYRVTLKRTPNINSIIEMTQDGKISITANGDINIESTGGDVNITADGDVNITGAGEVNIDGTTAVNLNGPGGGVVTDQCMCSFTGAPHPQGSTTVKAGL